MINSYRGLIVWQKSIDLVIEVYSVTDPFPKTEQYALTSQIRRAATAVPANIAEGYSRGHRKEYIRFLRIAFSSGAKLETHLIVAERLKFSTPRQLEKTVSLLSETMKMLNALIRSLESTV